MQIAKKRDIIVVGVVLCFVFFGIPWYYKKVSGARLLQLYKVASCIELYMEKNDGRLPGSEADLTNEGLVKAEPHGESGLKYNVRYRLADTWFRYSEKKPDDASGGWAEIKSFDRYNIRYGTQVEHVVADDGKLYDKHSNEQILLIKGPYETKALKKGYELVSFELYQKMLETAQRS